MKTLDAYLRNETSITKSSVFLYIHRRRLTKRLNKIKGGLRTIRATRTHGCIAGCASYCQGKLLLVKIVYELGTLQDKLLNRQFGDAPGPPVAVSF